MSSSDYASDATSLGESTDRLEAEGFTGQFGAVEGPDGSMVKCYTCHQDSRASDVELIALRRTEGASDPDDMTAVAAVICPHCGTRGTLVLKYGAIATPEEDDVLLDLEDHRDRARGGLSDPAATE